MIDKNHNNPAYMQGFLDGYKLGEERNSYEYKDSNYLSYKDGYAAGVTHYCNEVHPEDEGV